MFRGALALLLWSAFAGVAFGWRTYVQLRRHGDAGWRIRPGGGPVALVAHGAFVAAIVASVAAPVAALALGGAHRPGGPASLGAGAPVLVAFGALLMVLGAALAVRAQLDMGASWRIGVDEAERTELVTSGSFARVRNPIFTGMLLALAGQLLLVPNLVSAGALVAGAVGLHLQVRHVEEPYLAAAHGPHYLDWATRTGRFLPGLGRLHPDQGSS